MYSITNFIKTYIPSDTCIVLQDSVGRVTNALNVCKYLDLGTTTNVLWVTLSGNLKLNLPFDTTQHAQQAASALRNVLDSLYPNCALQTPIPPLTPYTTLTVTVTQYLVLITNSTVAAFQWYDISDPGNQFGLGVGEVYRVLPLTINDPYPEGTRLSNKEKIFLNFVDLRIEESLIEAQHLKTSGEGQITTDIYSTFLTATNGGSIVSTNSNNIEANNSLLSVDSCNNIKAEESKVIIANSSEVILRSIQGVHGISLDVSPYVFNDVQVDIGTSIGKQGREFINIDPNEVLYAYQRNIYQVILPSPLLIADLVKLLDNPFIFSNATFKFLITTTLNGHSLTIQDKSGNPLKVITDAYLGREVSFIYNNQTGLFELEPIESVTTKKINITVSSNGQTTFTGVTLYPPVYPTISILFINGVEQRYSIDYYFNNSDLIWNSSSHILETTDRVELLYT